MSWPVQRKWTDEQIGLLKRRHGEGASSGRIANELGISRNAVIGKAHRLGLTRKLAVTARVVHKRKHRKPGKLAAASGVIPVRLPAPDPSTPFEKTSGAQEPRRDRPEAPPALPAAEATDLAVEQSLTQVPFLERRERQCSWPLNATRPVEEHMVCGAEATTAVVAGRVQLCSWCLAHWRIGRVSVRSQPKAA